MTLQNDEWKSQGVSTVSMWNVPRVSTHLRKDVSSVERLDIGPSCPPKLNGDVLIVPACDIENM